MELPDDLFHLEQGLREAGPSGRRVRYVLPRHFSKLVQRLTCSPASDIEQVPLAEADTAQKELAATTAQGQTSQLASGTSSGDDLCQRQLRADALEVFDECPLSGQDYVALWMDAVPVAGHSLLPCMA